MTASFLLAAQRSNQVRSERSRIKASVRRRHITLAEVLDSPAVQTMRISDLLECVPGISPMKSSKLLLTLGLGYYRPIETLTRYERGEIFRLLRLRHPLIRVRP